MPARNDKPRKASSGRESRNARILEDNSGSWGSSSQDFIHLANRLFEQSADYAKNTDGNCSFYALAGIPLLFSGLRCLLIELNAGMYNGVINQGALTALANPKINDITVISNHYKAPDKLEKELGLLYEVRNEIIHPAHRPGAEKNNTPRYLDRLRVEGLLQSTGTDVDYCWIDQLKSHKLFTWAFVTVKEVVQILLDAHAVPKLMAGGLLDSYSRFELLGSQRRTG